MADYQSIYEGQRMDELWTLAGQAVQGIFVTTGGQEVEAEKDENGKVHINIGYLSLFRYDEETNTIYAGDSDHPVNFAAFGELTAGGIGGGTPTPGSGTLGGLVNVVAEADNPQLTDKILVRKAGQSVTHWTLADLPVIQVQEAPIDGKQYARKNGGWIEVQSADITPLEDAVKSLQSQIDSVASRTGFDEIIATSLFADTLVGTNAIFGQINGIDFAVKAAYWDAHITNTSNPHNVTWAQVKPTGGVALTDLASGVQTTLSHADSLWSWFGIDSQGRIYVKDGRSFYTEGEITAGGVGSGGGGTTGGITRIYLGTTPYQPAEGSTEVTLPAYPTTLPASDVYPWAKAAAKPTYSYSEIQGTPELSNYYTKSETEAAITSKGYITASALSPYRTASAQDAIDSLLADCVQSLQSQIDSVASKTDFDELLATSLYVDTLAASNGYFGQISVLGGIPLSALTSSVQASIGKADTALQSANIKNLTLQKNGVQMGVYNPLTASTIDFPDVASAQTLADLKSWIESMFEKDTTSVAGQTLIKAKFSLYSEGELTAGGIGQGGGGTTGGITRIFIGANPYAPAEGSTEVTLPAYPVVPTALSAFTDDVNHRLVTDAQITAWNAKQNSLGAGTNGQILSWSNGAPTWIAAPATGVTTFNSRTGAVVLTAADVNAVISYQAPISDLSTIRTRADEGHTAYGWGNHASAGYLVASNLTPIENAIKSLQSQVDSVSARDGFDELIATSLFADTLVGTNIYGALHGNADSATNADTLDGQHSSAFAHIGAHNNLTASGNEFTFASSGFSGAIYLNYRTAGGTNGNITDYIFSNGAGGTLTNLSTLITRSSRGETAYNDLTTVSKAIQSLQSQIDSVAYARNFDELILATLFSDMISAGNVYANGFYKSGSSNSYVLLGGGGHKAESSLSVASAVNATNLTGGTVNATTGTFSGNLTVGGNLLCSGTGQTVGSSAKPWGAFYGNKWYPNANDTTNYIEYTNGGFLIHGNVAAMGEITAGA